MLVHQMANVVVVVVVVLTPFSNSGYNIGNCYIKPNIHVVMNRLYVALVGKRYININTSMFLVLSTLDQ